MLADWLRHTTDRAFAPRSAGAFGFAALCVAAATVLRFALGYINPDLVPFATYFPAILAVALFAGVPAAIAAVVLSIAAVGWLFGPPGPVTRLEVLNAALFAVVRRPTVWPCTLGGEALAMTEIISGWLKPIRKPRRAMAANSGQKSVKSGVIAIRTTDSATVIRKIFS